MTAIFPKPTLFALTLSVLSYGPALASDCPINEIYANAFHWADVLVETCIQKHVADERYGFCAAAGACANLSRKVITESKLEVDLELDGELINESTSPGHIGLKIKYSFSKKSETFEECYSVHEAFADNVTLMMSTMCPQIGELPYENN